jgi:methionyl-tRNA formyltransferase
MIRPEDHGVIAGFNQIFKSDTIGSFRSLVNFHPSVLPFYRGPVPSYWCLANKEVTTGYTLHAVTGRIDDGEILFQEAVSINEDDSERSLDAKIAKQAAPTFFAYLQSLVDNSPWTKVRLDASAIYKHHVDYLSFPT